MEYIEHFLQKTKVPNQVIPIIIDNSPESQERLLVKLNYKKTESYEIRGYQTSIYLSEQRRIVYCYPADNLGYAKGNNLGTIISDELFNSQYYIISNNDIKLIQPFDEKAFQSVFNEHPDVAVIGPRVLGLDGKPQSPHKKVSAFIRLIAYYWFCRWPFRWKPDYDYDGSSKYCYRVMGSFMIIKCDAFREASRFDPNTFMFAEEPILSERLLKIGYKTFFYNEWTVIHEHGASISKANSQLASEQWAFDSCCYYYREYRKTSNFTIKVAELNFHIYKRFLKMRLKLKGLWSS